MVLHLISIVMLGSLHNNKIRSTLFWSGFPEFGSGVVLLANRFQGLIPLFTVLLLGYLFIVNKLGHITPFDLLWLVKAGYMIITM